MKTQTKKFSGTCKVRRDVLGGERGAGHALQAKGERVKRKDARKVDVNATSAKLTSMAGLATFGGYIDELGLDHELANVADRLKTGGGVVYPMGGQLRMLVDAQAVGATRVFDIEALSADPLFVHLCGGYVPSIDTIYRDLARFDADALHQLDALMFKHGVTGHHLDTYRDIHLDIDSTVEVVYGSHEGAAVGYNPSAHGRPSYHPILARLAETNSCVGAILRHGDTSFGGDDAPTVGKLVTRMKSALARRQRLFVRIDSAGDCAAILAEIGKAGAFYVIKARATEDLVFHVASESITWITTDWDADGKPTTQVAEVPFTRDSWRAAGIAPRVIAVRTTEDRCGKQLMLWGDEEWAVRMYLTNSDEAPESVAARYDGRAGIETMIAEWKNEWGIAETPSWHFRANYAALLIKMLSFNLLRRFVRFAAPQLVIWRADWVSRTALRRRPSRSLRPTDLHRRHAHHCALRHQPSARMTSSIDGLKRLPPCVGERGRCARCVPFRDSCASFSALNTSPT